MPSYEDWKQSNWDRAHKEKDISALTGTGIGGHLHTLHLKEIIKPNFSVLCVGVGTGKWVEEMEKEVREVWALDISPWAAKNIPKTVRFFHNPRDLPLNHFDLVLSLWVAPHMSNRDLQTQLEKVIPSLKPEGIFAIHYKEPVDPSALLDNREGAEDEYKRARAAEMLRRREHFNSMVEWAGGYVDKTFGDNLSYFYQVIEAIAHVKRRAK